MTSMYFFSQTVHALGVQGYLANYLLKLITFPQNDMFPLSLLQETVIEVLRKQNLVSVIIIFYHYFVGHLRL